MFAILISRIFFLNSINYDPSDIFFFFSVHIYRFDLLSGLPVTGFHSLVMS